MSEGAGTKRSSEGGNWGGKKMRGDSVTLRFLLHSKHAGGIIGKGGETIKRLRSEFSATVTVPDTNTNERVLSIGAEKDNCIKVLRESLPLMHEPPYPVNTGGQGKESAYEVDFLVHSSQVGGIIGRAGFKIKQLREDTHANIKVYQECLPDSTERVVAIGGEEDQVVNALNMMLEVMQEQPIKGNITLYDPSYDHNQNQFDDYYNNFNGPPGPNNRMGGGRGGGGGMGGGNRMGVGPRGGMRGNMGGGMGGGPGGPGGRGPPGNFGGPGGPQGGFGGSNGAGGGGLMGGPQQDNFGGNFGNNYNNDFNQGPQGGDGGFGGGAGGNFGGGAGGNFGGGPGGGNAGNAPSTTTQVTIPNDMAGAIIGKGGERIRGIRQKCGADIKFSDSDPGKKDRLITICGSQDQIQYAQYLMQQCVRQHHS